MQNRVCVYCSKAFTGRAGKLFCSNTCRSAQNNQLRKANYKYVDKVNAILLKNRNILLSLAPEGKAVVSSVYLEALGFDLTYFTNVFQTDKGAAYYFCYEYGYHINPDNTVAIFKKK
jgi:predicted nucleic acid-binding Zn ribbon protein